MVIHSNLYMNRWFIFPSLLYSSYSKMIEPMNYKNALGYLNSLPSNSQYIASSALPNHVHNKIDIYKKYMSRVGLSTEKLQKLSVIHVTGTKGKGSTCAMVESILRHHGYKTGFFSSPHLIDVRERIRLNGDIIGQKDFSRYFQCLFHSLDKLKEHQHDMPTYFCFLTTMAFYIFLDHEVDVAIIEVGIGGEYDCTNVFDRVPVIGITQLDMDHTSLLGNTIESIAWNKAGIMKKGCTGYTVNQAVGAIKVLQDRSIEKQCNLEIIHAPKINKFYNKNSYYPMEIFNINGALAVALCKEWIASSKSNIYRVKGFNATVARNALYDMKWHGRFQVIYEGNKRFFLDGAHTKESIKLCANWFHSHTMNSDSLKVLFFNVTGERDAKAMLSELKKCNFRYVIFTPNVLHDIRGTNNFSDSINKTQNSIIECEMKNEIWKSIFKPPKQNSYVVSSIEDAVKSLSSSYNYDILVTGSLHLIGAMLQRLNPDLDGALNT